MYSCKGSIYSSIETAYMLTQIVDRYIKWFRYKWKTVLKYHNVYYHSYISAIEIFGAPGDFHITQNKTKQNNVQFNGWKVLRRFAWLVQRTGI